jgi:hypothetical protein
MRTLPLLLSVVTAPFVTELFLTELSAQTFLALPSTANPTAELPNFSLVPFMQPNARCQLFYDNAETGSLPFTANELALRFDGPIPQVGAQGPFSITRLQIRIGTSAVPAPGADFAANLTQPLTTVFDGPVSYLPDPGSAAPHPWGGTNGTLTFPFLQPTTLLVSPGEWLVIDLTMTGNNIAAFGFSHAILDGANTSGGVTDGSAAAYGLGCSASVGASAATLTTSGTYAPGAAHRLAGQNLGPNALALGVFGLSNTMAFAPLPFQLPGTNCSLLASPDFTLATTADGAGTTAPNSLVLALPAAAALSGVVIYEQIASLVPTANPWGIVFSNAVAVTLGSFAAPGRGTYLCAHDTDQNATYANQVRAFGLALRLRIQ